MSEFDVNLISAFAKCPAFYDKSNPNFKDRAFTENAWKEISLQLGFDEKVLRDRMFQLRNRYNLEKRKVEMQDGDPNAKSTWPLFDRMSFLEGHIRPRKSYKSLMNRAMENNDQQPQFAQNAMFFNHRNNQQMRQYPQHPHHHPFAMQNAHNARLQQLANHIQMMANNSDDLSMELNGDSFPGLPSNLAMELSLLEGSGGGVEDRSNPLHLFQQQQTQQQPLNLQHQQQQQLNRQQQFARGNGGGDNSSEIKAEYYSESDDDEDGLRDTETDTTSKSKEDASGSFGQRITDASSSQVLGDLLNSVAEDASTNVPRNDNQSRNGTVSEPGQSSTVNEVDDTFLNPMDILLNRQSTGSAQNLSSGNVRYPDNNAMKRKPDNLTQTAPQNSYNASQQAGHQMPTFKRRRRNYHNMTANGMLGEASGNTGMRPALMQHPMPPMGGFQGSNALLAANQAMLLAQLQNTLTSQQATFLQQATVPSMMTQGSNRGVQSAPPLPDKYVAFGQFMASSLSDLNEVKALELIGRFTLEVVEALKEQKTQSSIPNTNRTAAANHSGQQQEVAAVEHQNNNNHTNNLSGSSGLMQQQQQSNNNHLGEDKFQHNPY